VQVTNSKTDSESFTGICRSNTLQGSTDEVAATSDFRLAVSLNLNIRYKLSSAAELQSTLVVNAILIELSEFIKHTLYMNNDTISKKIYALREQNSARKQMECIFVSISDDSVTSIGTTIESGTHVVFLGKNIDKLTFAFITPLRSKDDSKFRFRPINTGLNCGR